MSREPHRRLLHHGHARALRVASRGRGHRLAPDHTGARRPLRRSRYDTLVQGLCNAAEVDGAVELLNEMCGSGIEPNVVVYSCLLPGYCKSSRWQDVGKVFEEMSGRGIQPDVIMFTGLIDSLCKEGKTGKAARVKGMMVERGMEPNAVTYDVLINSLCKEGWVREAMTLKNEMVAVVPGAGRWAACDWSE